MPIRSPLAPARFPTLPALAGVRLTGRACGLKDSGNPDVMLALLDDGTTVAGVFTTSRCPSAPVDWCKQIRQRGTARALVVNAGNANAFTGQAGTALVQATTEQAAVLAGCSTTDVYLASTGVIGVPLPAHTLAQHLPAVAEAVSPDGWPQAAEAICTTDTFPKAATHTVTADGKTFTINGIAKGSGMIAPDMATMLGFIFTDAAIPAPLLQHLLADCNARSFNAITVDGDTSTSDTVLAFATGKGTCTIASDTAPAYTAFRDGLQTVMTDLAHQIVRDGEGARKFITIHVQGAETDTSAHRIARSVANSPLVKTAIAGEDPNWGRIVMAVGKAGEPADRDTLQIMIGETLITRNGQVTADYDEATMASYMKRAEITVTLDIGLGTGQATVWTCDLTHGYITINADYRT